VDETAPAETTVNVGVTSRVSQARVGQDAFSRAVRDNYDHRCCFPGCEVDHDSLLVAAHITRWADDLESRGDVANGLCLCGLHDKAFECGLFTLTDEFRVQTDQSTNSAWVEAHLANVDGQQIKLGRIHPSARAVRQHRDRNA
jgi:putative restriction endonuclease